MVLLTYSLALVIEFMAFFSISIRQISEVANYMVKTKRVIEYTKI